MPRFYFELTDEGRHVADDEGVEFVDVETMQEAAMRAVGIMLSEQTSFPRLPWSMVILNDKRGIVAKLTFVAQ